MSQEDLKMSENGTSGPGLELPAASKLRAFARDKGIEIADRGIIPGSVVAAFSKAPKKIQKLYR